MQGRLVAGTEAGPVDLYEDLVGLWLGHVDLSQGCRGCVAAADLHGRIPLAGMSTLAIVDDLGSSVCLEPMGEASG